MTHHEVTVMFLSLGVLLGVARLMGELSRRLHQPAVLGEILAGILLGPTILGAVWPEAHTFLFPVVGANPVVHEGLTTLAVVLFLLVAGMEVDLSTIFRLRSQAFIIGFCGLALPFIIGFGLSQFMPDFLGKEPDASKLVFSLFLGIALAISALPVIAKTLMDLNLFRSDLGMVVIAAAIFHDIVGWVVFAIILSLMQSGHGEGDANGIWLTIALTPLFALFVLTAGRWAIHRSLPWLQAHTSWPGGVLGFAMVLGLLGAAFTEAIGIHAIFGAFIVGIALGDSPRLQQRTRATIEQFIAFIFAPLFFASIGLHINFITHFDWKLVLVILVIACIGQIIGSSVGAQLVGFPKRQSWAMGFALNARGAMEIVLALLALRYGVIGERLFVALVTMALVTSIIAGPLMQRVLQRHKPARFRDHLNGKAFLPRLAAQTRDDAIRELAAVAAAVLNQNPEYVQESVLKREQTMTTALPGGLAIPHARLVNLDKPLVAVGVSPMGIEWDAPDGKPTRLVIMVLTPFDADEAQLELLADIARTFQSPDMIGRAAECTGYTSLLALLNIQSHETEATA
jgi:Kef-type K+ transport system membrane component KefB/mannitol/fructose-specific phosphotransferase system IIA component (Ntr-type)